MSPGLPDRSGAKSRDLQQQQLVNFGYALPKAAYEDISYCSGKMYIAQ